MDTFETIKTVGAISGPIIAGISLFWQISKARAERKAKPKVSCRVSGSSIEISYNFFGPIMFLHLSYRTEVKSAFVDRVEAIFVHTQTNETHVLEARDFLEYRPDPTRQNFFPKLEVKEPFAPFGINTERYETKVILFHDPVCAESLYVERSRLEPIANQLCTENESPIPDEVVDRYNSSAIVTDVWTRVREAMYLRPGQYRVIIRSYVEDQQIDSSFYFDMSREQCDTLQANALAMVTLAKPSGPQLQYLSIFPQVKPEQGFGPGQLKHLP